MGRVGTAFRCTSGGHHIGMVLFITHSPHGRCYGQDVRFRQAFSVLFCEATVDHHSLNLSVLSDHAAVRRIEHHESLDSTNRFAIELLDSQPELPALVVADEQTAGRGRGGNNWWSPSGALLFSVVLKRTETAAELPPYSLAAGLAVRDALQKQSLADVRFKVKWPNDVYLEDRKICGILVEIPPHHRDTLVIGIGVNLNNSVMDAPADLQQRLTSMLDVHGHTFCRTTTLSDIVSRVIQSVQAGNFADLPERWQPHCWLTGKRVSIQQGDMITTGQCKGISDGGALLLETRTGMAAISSGVVTGIDSRPDA